MAEQERSSSVRRLSRRGRVGARRGSVILWMFFALPLILTMFFTVTTVGKLWLARAELQNLTDAAALAGAKIWGDGANGPSQRSLAHQAAQLVAESNTVVGTVLTVDGNNNTANVNNNNACPGTIELGALSGGVFAGGTVPATVDQRACRVDISTTVTAPWFGAGGLIGPFTIRSTSIAYYSSATIGAGTPRLVNITAASCP